MTVSLLFFFFVLASLLGISSSQIDRDLREKRNAFYSPPLLYPFGGTIKLVVGFAVPIKLAGRILVYGQNFQFQYALPQNATFFSNLSQNRVFSRRRRDLDWYGRDLLFNTLEQNFQRYGLNGRECLKKSICEAVVDPLIDEGLIGELLHLLLTPEHAEDPSFPEDFLQAAEIGQRNENCSKIFSSCPEGQGFLDRISRV
ncbi:uncharacterized protein LOC124953606 [Vespa velutina]|uniref:uncharacterized protein LOC124953606 n=1 Tax=Vespa velutina TaxID=202808 RepID=UPI001FB327C3|nr:uncharacterized protein LOC124953606 [Vespa velutina]XP_047361158.1 uncharacterized protein LOC124953606 [Vespa velutina]XP_047361159.1 uncharacterized protein LOC124953606 [Vespa velutina]XP_047361160.1 uncharacterized protein LOC124953606 [Vespa velutina]